MWVRNLETIEHPITQFPNNSGFTTHWTLILISCMHWNVGHALGISVTPRIASVILFSANHHQKASKMCYYPFTSRPAHAPLVNRYISCWRKKWRHMVSNGSNPKSQHVSRFHKDGCTVRFQFHHRKNPQQCLLLVRKRWIPTYPLSVSRYLGCKCFQSNPNPALLRTG